LDALSISPSPSVLADMETPNDMGAPNRASIIPDDRAERGAKDGERQSQDDRYPEFQAHQSLTFRAAL
jgi:hypothetical protein